MLYYRSGLMLTMCRKRTYWGISGPVNHKRSLESFVGRAEGPKNSIRGHLGPVGRRAGIFSPGRVRFRRPWPSATVCSSAWPFSRRVRGFLRADLWGLGQCANLASIRQILVSEDIHLGESISFFIPQMYSFHIMSEFSLEYSCSKTRRTGARGADSWSGEPTPALAPLISMCLGPIPRFTSQLPTR